MLLRYHPVALHDTVGLHIRLLIMILNGAAVIYRLFHLPADLVLYGPLCC